MINLDRPRTSDPGRGGDGLVRRSRRCQLQRDSSGRRHIVARVLHRDGGVPAIADRAPLCVAQVVNHWAAGARPPDPGPRGPALHVTGWGAPPAGRRGLAAGGNLVRGVGEREMGERLREVARTSAPSGRIPRPAGRRRCATPAGARTAPRASSLAALQGIGLGQPEAADQERALAGRQAVLRLWRVVAQHEAVRASSSRSIASTVPRTRGSSAGRKPTIGISSVLASSRCEPNAWTKAPRSRSKPRAQTSAWISSRSSRQRSTGPSRPNCSTALTAAVEGDPGHHLRVHEVLAAAAHLPDALVRLLPDLLQVLQQRALQVPAVLVRSEAAPGARMQPRP